MDGNNLNIRQQAQEVEQQYLKRINDKKTFYEQNKNTLSEEQALANKAEIIYLEESYKVAKENFFNNPDAVKIQSVRKVANGEYDDYRKKKIADIAKEIGRLKDAFGLERQTELPDYMYIYAFRPENLTEDKIQEVRQKLVEDGYLSIYRNDVLRNPGDELANQIKNDIHVNLNQKKLGSGFADYFSKLKNRNQLKNILESVYLNTEPEAVETGFLVY